MNNQMVQDLLRRKLCICVATVTEMCRILSSRSSFHAYSIGILEPCIIELNVIKRRPVDVLV